MTVLYICRSYRINSNRRSACDPYEMILISFLETPGLSLLHHKFRFMELLMILDRVSILAFSSIKDEIKDPYLHQFNFLSDPLQLLPGSSFDSKFHTIFKF